MLFRIEPLVQKLFHFFDIRKLLEKMFFWCNKVGYMLFRIEPLFQKLFCFGGHVKVSREGIILMKYSSEKRTSEFNKTRKGGNNEFPN
jgi:hypothetical protein